MFKRNGEAIDITTDLVIGEGEDAIQIPALSLQDPATRELYEIVEEADPERADDRFYWNGDLATPIDTAALQARAVEQNKVTTNALLAQTAWYLERAADPSSLKPIPEAIVEKRAAIRAASDANEARLLKIKNAAGFAAFVPAWPVEEI